MRASLESVIIVAVAIFAGCTSRPSEPPPEPAPAPARPAPVPAAEDEEDGAPEAAPSEGAKKESRPAAKPGSIEAMVQISAKYGKASEAAKAFFVDRESREKHAAAMKLMDEVYNEALALQEKDENVEGLDDLLVEISASLGDLANARPN